MPCYHFSSTFPKSHKTPRKEETLNFARSCLQTLTRNIEFPTKDLKSRSLLRKVNKFLQTSFAHQPNLIPSFSSYLEDLPSQGGQKSAKKTQLPSVPIVIPFNEGRNLAPLGFPLCVEAGGRACGVAFWLGSFLAIS